MKKSTVKCPECGGDTVLENSEDGMIRRCNNLIEIDADKPLAACEWWDDVHKNGHPKQNFISSNPPVIKSLPHSQHEYLWVCGKCDFKSPILNLKHCPECGNVP